jgi:hypothetical protein
MWLNEKGQEILMKAVKSPEFDIDDGEQAGTW